MSTYRPSRPPWRALRKVVVQKSKVSHALLRCTKQTTYMHPAWLEDKVTGSLFVIPSLYWPMSFIPKDIWIAVPKTSNSVEQAHQDAYQDGVGLSIVADPEGKAAQHGGDEKFGTTQGSWNQFP